MTPKLLIVVVATVIGGLLVAARLTAQPTSTDIYAGLPLDATLIRLDRHALDAAYEAQIIKLFGIWLADGGRDAGPITNGLRNARRAYGLAINQIAKRENELLAKDKLDETPLPPKKP